MFVCKHCKKEFDGLTASAKANHTRWCNENPKRSSYGNKGKQLNTPEAIAKRAEKIKQAHADGKYARVKRDTFKGKTHTDESKRKISEAALKSKHRRLKKGVVEYKGVLLDSSWELELAKRLDELEIEWIRPEPIPWVDANGVTRNYFPDFYLPKYNFYLDPKNPHAVRVQQEKLDQLFEQYDNIKILTSLEECQEFRNDVLTTNR